MKNFSLALLILLVAASCAPLANKMYKTPGQPESLLDKSSERVTFSLTAKTFESDLAQWIDKDQPTKAQLACTKEDLRCEKAQRILSSFAVSVTYVTPMVGKENVILLYERIVSRDCDNSFISNHHNYRNLHHPAFGCAVAANILQMVSDHSQITNPMLSGLSDADHALKLSAPYYHPQLESAPVVVVHKVEAPTTLP